MGGVETHQRSGITTFQLWNPHRRCNQLRLRIYWPQEGNHVRRRLKFYESLVHLQKNFFLVFIKLNNHPAWRAFVSEVFNIEHFPVKSLDGINSSKGLKQHTFNLPLWPTGTLRAFIKAFCVWRIIICWRCLRQWCRARCGLSNSTAMMRPQRSKLCPRQHNKWPAPSLCTLRKRRFRRLRLRNLLHLVC